MSAGNEEDSTSTDQGRTAVYIAFDAVGLPLYVGVSQDWIHRMGEHRRRSRFFQSIARLDVEYYPEWTEAMAREAYLIHRLRPQFNTTKSDAAVSGAALERARGKPLPLLHQKREGLLTIAQFAEKHPAFSVGALRALIFDAADRSRTAGRGKKVLIPGNGLAPAIIRIGQSGSRRPRVLIDEGRFFAWVDSQQGSGRPTPPPAAPPP